MPVTDIKELRLLPPLALGRLGSSDEPMHNYVVNPSATPTGFRQLAPAETLVVDPVGGAVVSTVTPMAVKFRDGAGRIKPVAPFLEVWARFTDAGPFEPLTLAALTDLGLTPADVTWDVRVGNLKVFRRTGDPKDRVTAGLSAGALATHARQDLVGTATNFRAGRSVRLGAGQYVRPTAAFPEVRFRFTPAAGLVFGHTAGGVIPASRAVYDPVAGRWDTYKDRNDLTSPTPRARLTTVPGNIFARARALPNSSDRLNLGYLDDSCDGIVRVSVTVGGRALTSFARVSSGPPDFAPDSDPVRSVADDFEQMGHGPEPAGPVTAEQVIDIVRRALETMRLMNSETENSRAGGWQASGVEPFGAAGARYGTTRAVHEGLLTAVGGLTAPPASPARAVAVASLEQLVRVLRDPDRTGDYSTAAPVGQRPGVQRMPALMRGSDGDMLCLSRWQQAVLRKAVDQFRPPPAADDSPAGLMKRLVLTLGATGAPLHTAIGLTGGGSLADLFATPDALLTYLTDPTSVAKGGTAATLGLTGQTLVVKGDPLNSAFFKMVTNPAHIMKVMFNGYTDPDTGDTGAVVVRKWISSL